MNINDTDIFSQTSPCFKGSVQQLFADATENGVLKITNQEDMTFYGKTLRDALDQNQITHKRIDGVSHFKMSK